MFLLSGCSLQQQPKPYQPYNWLDRKKPFYIEARLLFQQGKQKETGMLFISAEEGEALNLKIAPPLGGGWVFQLRLEGENLLLKEGPKKPTTKLKDTPATRKRFFGANISKEELRAALLGRFDPRFFGKPKTSSIQGEMLFTRGPATYLLQWSDTGRLLGWSKWVRKEKIFSVEYSGNPENAWGIYPKRVMRGPRESRFKIAVTKFHQGDRAKKHFWAFPR